MGHAHTITSDAKEHRFDDVEQQWKKITQNVVNDENDIQPILFGGFTFDTENEVSGEWTGFPEAFLLLQHINL